MQILKNKKVIQLFTQNSTSFFIKLIIEYSIVNLILIRNIKRGKFSFPSLVKTIFNKSVSLFIAYCKIHSFYKKLVYKKLGLVWLKTKEDSRAAINFLRKFVYAEN